MCLRCWAAPACFSTPYPSGTSSPCRHCVSRLKLVSAMTAKPYGIIYKITNTVNCKMYVGQTKNTLAHRWSQHQSAVNNCREFQRSLRKHGPGAFMAEQIGAASTPDELNRMEAHWITALDTLHPRGYNLRLGGNAPCDETRAIISAARKQYLADPAVRARASAAATRQWSKPEARANISAKAKERFRDAAFRAKSASAMNAARWTSEARYRQSAEMDKRYQDSAFRSMVAARMTATVTTPKYRSEQSVRRKQYFAEHPEATLNLTAAFRAAWRRRKILALLQSQIALMEWD